MVSASEARASTAPEVMAVPKVFSGPGNVIRQNMVPLGSSFEGAADDLTGIGAAPDPLTKIRNYSNPPNPDPSMPGEIEDLMLVIGAEAAITTFEPMPEMLAGIGTSVNMAGEPMDDSSAGFGDLADSPYFPRYGAAVC